MSAPSYQNTLTYGNSAPYPIMRVQPAMLKSVKLITPFFSSSVPNNPILIQTVPSASPPSQYTYQLSTTPSTPSTPSNVNSVRLIVSSRYNIENSILSSKGSKASKREGYSAIIKKVGCFERFGLCIEDVSIRLSERLYFISNLARKQLPPSWKHMV